MVGGRERMARLFHLQAEGCRQLGSLFYARLLAFAGDDIASGGVIGDVLTGHEKDPAASALALRLAGAVHRIVLEGRATDLARSYPSVGGTADAFAAWPAFRAVVDEHRDAIRAGLSVPPQTNEIGRAAVLFGGLLHVASATGLPIRLLEVGASAGLNLRADRFRYELSEGTVLGPADSPAVLRRPWAEGVGWPPVGATVAVVDRLGCDLDPVDPLTDEGRTRLASYVWPDQLARFERLRAAFEVAAALPAPVERTDAVDFLGRELAELTAGTATVVWHSILVQYLSKEHRAELDAVLADAGQRASADAPLVRFSLEPRRVRPDGTYAFVAAMTTWPGGGERTLAEAGGHGPPVRWR